MSWLWTWSGVSFGYRYARNQLRTHDGRHVGNFVEGEIYGPDGRYLGELLSDDRLITRQRKLGSFALPFRPSMIRPARTPRPTRAARIMRDGCQDFPTSEHL
jgi:hypothetical protein